MSLFSPVSKNTDEPGKPLYKSSNRVLRILYRFDSYKKFFSGSLRKGVPVASLVRTQFPYVLSDAKEPPILVLELTNYCNLKCPYCASPLGLRQRGYMSEELMDKIISELGTMRANRVQLIGNGESTLHPKFGGFINELAKTKRFISIVTNGQWINKQVPHLMLDAPLDLIELSIDAGGKEVYEASRINGSYEKIVQNIQLLKKIRDERKSKTLINVRLMVRPSQYHKQTEELVFWKQYADAVMPQYLAKHNAITYENDIYMPDKIYNNDFPKCSMPFKHMEVRWTGDVLLCFYSTNQTSGKGLLLGNVSKSSIKELWNCDIMRQYRDAHRKRIESNMPVCKGCAGT